MPRHLHPLLHALIALLLAVNRLACTTAQSYRAPETRNSRRAVPVQAEGLPNLFQIAPDLYRSAQPEAAGMRSAEALGIRTVLSLRTSTRDSGLVKGTRLLVKRVPSTPGASVTRK